MEECGENERSARESGLDLAEGGADSGEVQLEKGQCRQVGALKREAGGRVTCGTWMERGR